MKKKNINFLISVVTAIVILATSLGVGLFVNANTVPEPVVVNDGSGVGKNTARIYTYTTAYVENEVTGNKAIKMTSKNTSTAARECTININPVNNAEDITAISMYVEFPALSSGNDVKFSLRLNEYFLGWMGNLYAISKDNEFVSKDADEFKGGFKGTLLFTIPKGDEYVAKVLWNKVYNDKTYTLNTQLTWSEFITEFGGLKSLKAYVFGHETGKSIVVDNVTLHFEDAEALLKKNNLLVEPPISNVTSGMIVKNQKIDLTAEEGAEIYYTLDGSVPTKESEKYSAENMPVISSPCTLKAIAYKDDKQSLVTKYEYEFLPETFPNVNVLNPCEDLSTLKSNGSNDGLTSTKTLVENMSPHGTAVKYLGLGGTGASMWNVQFPNNLDNVTWAAQQAFAFWVSVPEGMDLSFVPCINLEKYVFKGKSYSYNTATHELLEYDEGGYQKLSGFEGYLIFRLDGKCIRGDWQDTLRYSFREFVQLNGFRQICFYQSHSEMYNKSFIFDNVISIADLDKFIKELDAQPKRPMPPTATPGSDAVTMDTQIFLNAGDTCSIYYTTDGTIPTYENGECTNGTLYETYSMGNGQEDASYIELKTATTIKAIAVSPEGVVSGIATYEYTIELPYTGPNVVVINNGTGEGNNTFGWYSQSIFDKEKAVVVDNNSPDGKGLQHSIITPDNVYTYITYKVETEGVEQIHNVKGFSYHVTVPDMPTENHRISFSACINGESNYLYGKICAISDDGETVIQGTDSIYFSKAFSGTVYMVFDETNSVGQTYGSVKTNWFKFMKANKLTSVGFRLSRTECDTDIGEEYQHTFVLDEFSFIYDTDKLFEDIELEEILAVRDADSFENTNMIVTNDGSGYIKNHGLNGFSSELKIEKSDQSADERCLKLTFAEGESFIKFMPYSQSSKLSEANGTTFWVEIPKGIDQTNVNIKLTDYSADGTEIYEYSNRWYYLSNINGVISKRYGEITLPDGFRGWVIIPKDNMKLANSVSVNGTLDYNQISDIEVIFPNKDNELLNRSVFIDDISFYTSFTDLVKSRAQMWLGQIFE